MTGLANVSGPLLLSAYSTKNVIIFIFLPYAFVIFTFIKFFLINLTIVREEACGYGSIYEMVSRNVYSHRVIEDLCRVIISIFVYTQVSTSNPQSQMN